MTYSVEADVDFVEIVIDGPIQLDRDDVEEALTDALGGAGEVTGAGTSEIGSHLDLEIDPIAPRQEVLDAVFRTLIALGIGDSARVRPGDASEWTRPSDWRT
jgi:hypothetical protein